jgi:hypothetical protein
MFCGYLCPVNSLGTLSALFSCVLVVLSRRASAPLPFTGVLGYLLTTTCHLVAFGDRRDFSLCLLSLYAFCISLLAVFSYYFAPSRGCYSSLGEIGVPLPRSACAAFVLSIDEAPAIWWSLLSGCLCDMGVALCPSIIKEEYRHAWRLALSSESAAKVLLYLASKIVSQKKWKKIAFSL